MTETCDRCKGSGQERDMDSGSTIVCRDCNGTGEDEIERLLSLPPWPKEASNARAMSHHQAALAMDDDEAEGSMTERMRMLLDETHDERRARVERWAERNNVVLG